MHTGVTRHINAAVFLHSSKVPSSNFCTVQGLAARRLFSTGGDQEQKRKREGLVEAQERPKGQLTVGAKVAQAGRDVSYFAVILAGLAITGGLLWYTFSELFTGLSPNSVYSKALKKVKKDSQVIEFVGTPIKGYGEETARGRRRHVSHQEYIVDGQNFMRVKFYIKGSKRKGTVQVDVKQIGRGKYETRFLFVELDGFPAGSVIIVEDNR